MGDRYELIENCAYCGEIEEDVWYAPTCNSFGFTCRKCGKYNFITTDFKVKKVDEITYDDVYWAVCNASNMMNEKQIESSAKGFYDNLKKDELTEIMKEKLKQIEEGGEKMTIAKVEQCEKFVVFKGKKFYSPYKCLCCGKEVSEKQFCYGRMCAYCDCGRCQRDGFHFEEGHNRKDIFEDAEEMGDELQEVVKTKLRLIKNGNKRKNKRNLQ